MERRYAMNLLKAASVTSVALLICLFAVYANGQEHNKVIKGDPAKGKEVFRVTACWRCHDVDTGVSKRPPAPSLKDIYNRPPHLLSDGTKHEKHTDEMFIQIITEGTKAMNPRGAVLTDDELADLLAYLHTL